MKTTMNLDQEIKPMIYGKNRKFEVLLEGQCFGYQFYIVSLGTHPTAYVEIPLEDKFYKKDAYFGSDLDVINVHGGITYSASNLWFGIKGWFIGWDYAHAGDYVGYYDNLPKYLHRYDEKKWTTEEILDDVIDVTKQLRFFNYDK